MELRRALSMFRLGGRVPMEELNSSFRDLVKKYHPDKVRDYPEWAHERMAEINDAYETLAAWIAEPPKKKVPQQDVHQTESPVPSDNFSNDAYEKLHRRDTPVLSKRLAETFYPAFNGFLDGLGLYYQYGLEHASFREEGVRRFRFREALRTAEKNRDTLEKLSKEINPPVLKSVSRFARLTVADMNMGDPAFPKGAPGYSRFDRRFKNARRDFDSAVREILFPELLPAHRRGNSGSALYSSYTEFILFVTVFTDGERRKAGILQSARYDSFMDLIELRNDGILSF